MSAKSEIEKRHAERRMILKDSRRPLKVVITDKNSVKDAKAILTDAQADLLEKCFLVDQDMQVLLVALNTIAIDFKIDVEDCVRRAWEKCPLSDEEQQVLWDREVRDAEAREKELEKSGKPKDIPGQTKLSVASGTFQPSTMPSAEEAGPVTTRPLGLV